jgi:hypothetical protein
MTEPSVVSCKWARLTLTLPYPLWIDSERQPWSCVRGEQVRELDDTDRCRVCPYWLPRDVAPTLPRRDA